MNGKQSASCSWNRSVGTQHSLADKTQRWFTSAAPVAMRNESRLLSSLHFTTNICQALNKTSNDTAVIFHWMPFYILKTLFRRVCLHVTSLRVTFTEQTLVGFHIFLWRFLFWDWQSITLHFVWLHAEKAGGLIHNDYSGLTVSKWPQKLTVMEDKKCKRKGGQRDFSLAYLCGSRLKKCYNSFWVNYCF